MEYQIITKQEYHKYRKTIINMIKELFKNDDSKIANIQDFSNHWILYLLMK